MWGPGAATAPGRACYWTGSASAPTGGSATSSGPGEAVRGGLRLLGDHRPVAGGVEDVVLEPRVAAGEQLLGGRVLRRVVVGPQRAEQLVRAAARLLGEQVGQLEGLRPARRLAARERRGVDARARDRVQLRADVDDPAQLVALLLQAGLVAPHGVERRPRELARRPLDVAHVAGDRPELAVGAALLPFAGHEGGEPLGVEARRLDGVLGLVGQRGVGIEHAARRLQVLVDGLARDQQVHDLGRALEDPVDAHVAQHLLRGDGLLAARPSATRPSRTRGRRGPGSSRPRTARRARSSRASRSPPRCGSRCACRRPGGSTRRRRPRARTRSRR